MVANTAWTSDELDYLAEHGIDAYRERYPGYRTYDAVRVKHGVLKRDGYVPGRIGPLRDVRDEVPLSETDRDEPREITPPTVTSITGVQAGERPDVDEIRQRHEAQYRRVAKTAERKLFQQITISHAPAMIALVADVHLGSPYCDVRRVFEEQDLINRTPGAYTFLLGDIVDNFIIGKLTAQNMGHGITIPEEWELFEYYLRRWENVQAVVGGNHDKWTAMLAGADLRRRFYEETALYDTDDLRVTVNVGGNPILFRLRHKFAGYSQYNVTHGHEKSVMFDDPRPDIVVAGHTHQGALAREFTHGGRRKIAIQLGTYKSGTMNDYVRTQGFPQGDNSTAAAVIVMPDGSYFATGSLRAACTFMQSVYRGAA